MHQPEPYNSHHVASQKEDWIELRLLDAVESGRFRSQREASAELGIALGLVNAYVKRCVRKGWLKISNAPARRYAYYLTPQGFAEKAQLSARYLQNSMNFFRKARTDYAAAFARGEALGWRQVALVGMSDLTEIAGLCALESEIEIVAVIAPEANRTRVFGVPVIADLHALPKGCDGFILTAIDSLAKAPQQRASDLDAAAMLVPSFLERSLFEADTRTPGEPS
jgi:DNA-binding MarR family transcriptional regulator